MLLTCKIWNDVEILHTIAILLSIKNLNTGNLVVCCFSLIKFTFMHILLVWQAIQKFLFFIVIEKLWFSAKSVAIYDSITSLACRCVYRIKLFGSLRFLAGLCGTATALFTLLERCFDLNYFIVNFVTIIESETIGVVVIYNIIWVMLNSVHFRSIIVISFDFVVIQLCAFLIVVLRRLLDCHLAGANI